MRSQITMVIFMLSVWVKKKYCNSAPYITLLSWNMQLLILYTVFHFAITHDTYAVADHKGYHVYGIHQLSQCI